MRAGPLGKTAAILLLTACGLVFFADLVLHSGRTLYADHSDLLAEHVPARRFLVRSLRQTGELPLWCPLQFAGSPFAHDIQVGLFYPLHWPLYLLSEEHIGAGLSWLIVLHALLAGWGAFAYATHRGLEPLPALVAGAGFMLAPRWMLHLLGGGHYVTIGLAWLPWTLLCLEKALSGRFLAWTAGGGLCLGLMILSTQPQWTFYSSLFIAAWSFGRVLDEGRTLLGRWLATGLGIVLLGAGLAAVQLLPTLEAARHSSRAAGVGDEEILAGGLRVLAFLIGPALTAEPYNLAWEDRGGLALLWLLAAILAAVLRPGLVRYQAGVCLALFVFAMGGAILFQPLPGFNLFRQPARMALVAAFPIAYLTGVATQALFAEAPRDAEQRRRVLRTCWRVGVAGLILTGGFALRQTLQGGALVFHVYWLALPVLFGLAVFILAREPSQSRAWAWAAVLLAELFAFCWPLVRTREDQDIYPRPECVALLAQSPPGTARVLDFEPIEAGRPLGSPLGNGVPLALVYGIESAKGYSPLDVLRYRQYLQWIAGEDRPLRALDGPFTYPVVGNLAIRDRRLLDLLGVRYLLLPAGQSPPGENWRQAGVDAAPRAYDFVLGGMRQPGPYVVWENLQVLPRALVVPGEVPEGKGLPDSWRSARITSYTANEVRIAVDAPGGGHLVLCDVWFPGWTCRVDGTPTEVRRAYHVFRAVALPAGAREVVYRFDPPSLRAGKRISLITLALAAVLPFLPSPRRIGTIDENDKT